MGFVCHTKNYWATCVNMRKYAWNVLIWIDQGVNVVFAPVLNVVFKPAKFGDPDETLSSVFGKYSNQCIWCSRICKLLNLVDKNHCKDSIE